MSRIVEENIILFAVTIDIYNDDKTESYILHHGNDFEEINHLYDLELQRLKAKYISNPIDKKEVLCLKNVQEDIIIRSVSSFDFL